MDNTDSSIACLRSTVFFLAFRKTFLRLSGPWISLSWTAGGGGEDSIRAMQHWTLLSAAPDINAVLAADE